MKNIPSHRWSGKQAASSQKQVVYRVKNWAVYNESLVQRGSLTVWLSQEAIDGWRYDGPAQRGAQFLYSDQALEMARTLRKLFGLALRQTQGFCPVAAGVAGVGAVGAGLLDAVAASPRAEGAGAGAGATDR